MNGLMNCDDTLSDAVVRFGGCLAADVFERHGQLRIEKIGTELLGHAKLAGVILCHVDGGMVVVGRRLQCLHRHGNCGEGAAEQVRSIVDNNGGDAGHYRRSIQQTQSLLCFELQEGNSLCFQSLRCRDAPAAVKHGSTPEHCPCNVCHCTKVPAGPYRSVAGYQRSYVVVQQIEEPFDHHWSHAGQAAHQ